MLSLVLISSSVWSLVLSSVSLASCSHRCRWLPLHFGLAFAGLEDCHFTGIDYLIFSIHIFLVPTLPYQTPQSPPPLGLVFANFMLCSFAGVSVFHFLTRLHFSSSHRFEFRSYHALVLALGVALAAFCSLVAATRVNALRAPPFLTLIAFFALEFAAGL